MALGRHHWRREGLLGPRHRVRVRDLGQGLLVGWRLLGRCLLLGHPVQFPLHGGHQSFQVFQLAAVFAEDGLLHQVLLEPQVPASTVGLVVLAARSGVVAGNRQRDQEDTEHGPDDRLPARRRELLEPFAQAHHSPPADRAVSRVSMVPGIPLLAFHHQHPGRTAGLQPVLDQGHGQDRVADPGVKEGLLREFALRAQARGHLEALEAQADPVHLDRLAQADLQVRAEGDVCLLVAHPVAARVGAAVALAQELQGLLLQGQVAVALQVLGHGLGLGRGQAHGHGAGLGRGGDQGVDRAVADCVDLAWLLRVGALAVRLLGGELDEGVVAREMTGQSLLLGEDQVGHGSGADDAVDLPAGEFHQGGHLGRYAVLRQSFTGRHQEAAGHGQGRSHGCSSACVSFSLKLSRLNRPSRTW